MSCVDTEIPLKVHTLTCFYTVAASTAFTHLSSLMSLFHFISSPIGTELVQYSTKELFPDLLDDSMIGDIDDLD